MNGLFFPLRERGLFGLAPGGVYLATPIAQGTGELLPRLFTLTLWNGVAAILQDGMFSVALSFPPARRTGDSPRYGPPCPVELGLSSPPGLRRSGHLFPFDSPPFLYNPPPLPILSWPPRKRPIEFSARKFHFVFRSPSQKRIRLQWGHRTRALFF